MTITVPTLTAEIAHDAEETLIGTLAPTGGVGPYEVVAIWPAAGDPPEGHVLPLAAWRSPAALPESGWRAPAVLAGAGWRAPTTLPEADWS